MARLTSSASSLPSSSVLLLVLPLIALPLASAAQISWLSASVGGSWHDAANWDLNRVPAADGTLPAHLWVARFAAVDVVIRCSNATHLTLMQTLLAFPSRVSPRRST